MARTHGLRKHPLYRTWADMRQRCSNPLKSNYQYYGGRGIRVCERWDLSFPDFLADVGERPDGTTLDRINPDGDYEPQNCRWAPKITQANNTRFNRLLIHGGLVKTLAEWARETGIREATIRRRIDVCGWTADRALTNPIRRNRRWHPEAFVG
jgi:hypothetical protein